MSDRPAVLFVCLGNICRSPLAEAAFRHVTGQAGFPVLADSAGTSGWHIGDPPDRRAQAVARKHGIDIGSYRGRRVSTGDFLSFTHIIALDRDNLESLHGVQPAGATAELRLLLDYVDGRAGQSVEDPYYGGPEGFDRVWDEVLAGAQGLLTRLMERP